MNVLVAHNFYQQPGGEDQVFADEVELLRANGHIVTPFTVHNDRVNDLGKLQLARKTLWNGEIHDRIRDVVRRDKIDIAHFHNTFPLISPASYYGAREGGAKVVQTLHNFRLQCPAATFFRDGHVCEECLRAVAPWPAVAHACYRQSRAASAVSAAMLVYHRAKHTYDQQVDTYICLTNFAKAKAMGGGIPAGKIVVKPNFVSHDPGVGSGGGGYMVFVGRLVPEKGIQTLLAAWKGLTSGPSLKILGDGPLQNTVIAAAESMPGVEYLGRRKLSDVHDIVARAEALVFPSEWYEPFGRTIVEAYASGTPVIATRIGGVPELVRDGVTGRLFSPGNAAELAQIVREFRRSGLAEQATRDNCRKTFLENYTAKQNYPMLMKAYEHALSGAADELAPPQP